MDARPIPASPAGDPDPLAAAAGWQGDGQPKARPASPGLSGLALLALISLACNLMAFSLLRTHVVGWGNMFGYLFKQPSLLINPATAAVGALVAVLAGRRAARCRALAASSLALGALVLMWTSSYGEAWPLFLGSGLTLAAAALILRARMLDQQLHSRSCGRIPAMAAGTSRRGCARSALRL
ncbi:MAG TPA: hypothetical protein VM536_13465 [Chloroflexia bacterium]|nr:hypothetical protein [Chloroflexia bacterium]